MGVMSLFGEIEDAGPLFDERPPIPAIEFAKRERLSFEKEMLGLYVSDHPLMGAEASLRRRCDGKLTDLAEMEDGTIRTFGGVVTSVQRKWTKKGDLMAVFALEDLQTVGRGDGVPQVDDRPRPQARRRRHRHRAGPGRRPGRPAEAHRHGDRAVRADERRGVPAPAEGGGRGRCPRASSPTSSGCWASTPATRRCCSTSARARSCGSPRRGRSRSCPGLLAELRVLLGPTAIMA